MTRTTLSTEPYRGTRDFYPEDMFVQHHIFSTMRTVVERFGYVSYDASILEPTDLYRAKSGSEIVDEQTYSFTDRGGRDVTIRPEMTPTVARMVARRRRELTFPLRWYSIPNLFRYERPQRGRLREHWQLNVDAFGMIGADIDAEIIAVADALMRAFGAKSDQYRIRVSNRKLLTAILASFDVTDDAAHALTKLIDRKAKLAPAEFDEQATALLGDRAGAFTELLAVQSIDALPDALATSDGAQELRTLLDALRTGGIANAVFDPTLVRGFDYYTGNVFEVFDTDPTNARSLFGGGRYDDLVGIFGVDPVPGIGFGMGDVTIRDFLETHGLLPTYTSPTVVYLCRVDVAQCELVEDIARQLREEGVSVAVDYTDRKLGMQVRTAERQAIPYVLCIGEQEAATQVFRVKHLPTGTEHELARDALVAFFRAR
ncbi:MAG: histidine--tRNA ligase [Candidatus Uhrbacteria bacterium]